MHELLEMAVAAHGGMERWNQIARVKAHASITGAIWHLKGRPDVLKDVSIEAETQTERLTMQFPGQGKRSSFEPKRVTIEADDGEAQIYTSPVDTFRGHSRETPWDDVHVAYFSGEALWTYLTIPFLYTYPGFEMEELTTWQENGEEWRRLKVSFPDSISSHTREQISYFGSDGLLRRHDYTVDILGGATGANYASDYRTVDGIAVPTKRRVYAYEGEHAKLAEPVLVAIGLDQVSFA